MSVPFLEAKPGQCRRPLWAGRDRTGDVCGVPAKAGSSYCRDCHALFYVPATARNVATIMSSGSRLDARISRQMPSPGVNPAFERGW